MIEQLESELRSALRARADELPAGARARVRALEYRPRTRDLRPPVAAGVLTTAAAAAAAVALIDLGPQAPAAFAGWSATPTRASAAQVAGATADCSSRLHAFSTGSAKAMRNAGIKDLPTISQMSPVLTDTRGPFTFVIYSGANGANGTCISGPQFTSLSTRSGGGVPALPAGKIAPSFEAHTAHAGDAYSFVEGHAGAGVTAATLVLSDGSHVQTTIQSGWLVAWWPGPAQLTSALVTTASGTATETFDTKAFPGCPPPPAGSTTPRDGACASAGFSGGGKGQAAGSLSMFNTSGGARPPTGSGRVTGTNGG
ncbi:MAG TPA: hypothetical protein VHW96_24210 [Solirubrobacteraceae bacterium]|jgi:hypothetical protein|nr:hypothetical protein [Solirubrobacteraceae bacterium]